VSTKLANCKIGLFWPVSTAEAIAMLRAKMGAYQAQLATRLGVIVGSISRYENGREPTDNVLRKLATLSREVDAQHLHDFFQAQRRSNIASNIEKLASGGTARRVSIDDLMIVMSGVNTIKRACALLASEEFNAEDKKVSLETIVSMVGDIEDAIGPYFTPVAEVRQPSQPFERIKRLTLKPA
jgi:transcriptional regulator with XRE-family HTH domain